MRGIVKGFVVGTLGLIQKGELRMRKSIVFTIALTTVAFVAGEASATKLTEQQVRNVCGKDLREDNVSMNCQKKCGDKQCDYACGKDKDGKATNCEGLAFVRQPTRPGLVAPGVAPQGQLTPTTPPRRVTPPAGSTLQK